MIDAIVEDVYHITHLSQKFNCLPNAYTIIYLHSLYQFIWFIYGQVNNNNADFICNFIITDMSIKY